MSTATLERPDLMENELKALDFDIECSEKECEAHASQWMVCRACAWRKPFCNDHLFARIVFYETHPLTCRRIHVVFCAECEAQALAERWRSLFDVIPIEGA